MTINERITGIYMLVAFVSVCFALGSYYARKSSRLTWMAVTQMQAQVSQLRDVVSTWQGVIDAVNDNSRQTREIAQNARETAYELSRRIYGDKINISGGIYGETTRQQATHGDSDGGGNAYSADGSANPGTIAHDVQKSDHPPSFRET